MKQSIYKSIVVIIILVLTINLAVQAQPGTLDTRFGDKGKIYEKDYRASADVVAVQKDGKILAAGNFYSGVGLHVSRYNTDGSLDENFAGQGRFILRDLEGYGIGTTTNMEIQRDGKILVGTRTILSSANQDISLIRLNTDGSLDNSFGGNGIVDLAIGPYDDEIGEMALQEDGRILVAGLKDPSGYGYYDNKIPMLLRLNTDGSYDESFGQVGKVIQNFNDVYVQIRAICILPDGKIIIGGEDDGYYDDQVIMFKYNTNGSIDTSFGNNGIAESRFPEDEYGRDLVGYINDLLIMPDGKVFACGVTGYGTLFISKFNSDGLLDSSFGDAGGYSNFNPNPLYSYGYTAHIVKGNKVVVVGSYGSGGFAAFRFLQNGSLDSSFNTNGVADNYFEVPAGIGRRGAAIQPDGKIILAGSGANRNDDYSHICMLRLHGDGGITPENYVKIKRWMKKNGFTWPGSFMGKGGNYEIQRSTNNIHFTTVASVNKTVPNNNEYAYEDPSPAKGNNYYRVAYTNKDGKKLYSNVITIENEVSVKIYPNPVASNLHLQGLEGKTKLYITDISGNIKMVTDASSKNFNWNVAALNKGYYVLKIKTEGKELITKKFYKQ